MRFAVLFSYANSTGRSGWFDGKTFCVAEPFACESDGKVDEVVGWRASLPSVVFMFSIF